MSASNPVTPYEHFQKIRRELWVQVYMAHIPRWPEGKVPSMHGSNHLNNAELAAKHALRHFDNNHAAPNYGVGEEPSH